MSAELRKFVSLIATVILVALAVAVVSILHLYRTALTMERKRLTQTVESQVLLIEAVARFDAEHSRDDNPGGAVGATISQIKDAYRHFHWFDQTGEILIARLEGASIVYINEHSRDPEAAPESIPMDSGGDIPMRLALTSQSGVMVARDYRGKQVLAAYAPVPELAIGLVAKIDMAEINAPYIRSAAIVGIGAVAIAVVGLLLASLTLSLIRRAETAKERERQNLLAIFDSIDEPIYVCDPVNNELLFVNDAFKQYWGEGVGQKCHRVIHGSDTPCTDCTTPMITGPNAGQSITREWYNANTDQWFRALDKAIQWPGHRLVRYEMAINITAEKKAQQAIVEQQERVRALSSQLSLSEEKERKRLATQLHDQIGHNLVATKMKLVQLKSANPGISQSPEFSDVIGLLEGTIEAVRSLTFEISPPVLHELGLDPALEWLVEQTHSRYGINAIYVGEPHLPRLDEELAVLLFQATRELLFNIYKHAAAKNAWVRLSTGDGFTTVEVEDDGTGFAENMANVGHDPGTGYGLLSISERMRFLGGEMTVRSAPGRGTKVVLRAPEDFTRTARTTRPQVLAGDGQGMPEEPDRTIRVLIADDHSLMRRGIHSILGGFPQFEIVGEAEDGQQALELAMEIRPNVVVMDIDMPKLDGIKSTRAILENLPDTRVLALSMHANKHFVRQMLQAGALGYLLKDSAAEELPQAIRDVDNHRIFLSPGITGVLVDEFVKQSSAQSDNPIEILSDRELEVVRLLTSGDSTKQVAISLGISQKTAQAHRQNILKKLGIGSTAELVQFAIREGIVSQD